MKKPHKKTADRPQTLRIRDLASVRGGENGVIHMQVAAGGLPRDNGVIHMG